MKGEAVRDVARQVLPPRVNEGASPEAKAETKEKRLNNQSRRIAAALVVLCLASGCWLSGKQKLNRERARKMLDLHATVAMERYFQKLNTKLGLAPHRERRITVERVTGLAFEPGEKVAHVDYVWHYGDGGVFRSQAEFRLYDDGWRLDEDALVGGILLGEPQH